MAVFSLLLISNVTVNSLNHIINVLNVCKERYQTNGNPLKIILKFLFTNATTLYLNNHITICPGREKF